MMYVDLQYLTHQIQMYYKFLLHLNVFCTFAGKMRNVAHKIFAVVLAVWYLMSIIGFGIHTCRGSQRSFLTTFISEVVCEDIHPEHHCTSAHHCCGDHQEHGCCGDPSDPTFESPSCCSDDVMVLSLTGTAPSSEDYGCSLCHCWHGPAEVSAASLHHLSKVQEINRTIQESDSGLPAPGDVQSVLGIWRI